MFYPASSAAGLHLSRPNGSGVGQRYGQGQGWRLLAGLATQLAYPQVLYGPSERYRCAAGFFLFPGFALLIRAEGEPEAH